MSGHRYVTDTKNLFSDDDIDDNTFLRNSSRSNPANNPFNTLNEQRMSILEKSREIEERTLRSTQKSISLLRESEQVGIATAEELQRQREKLEITDKRLDEINSTLRFSQKHINGIKSVFGSLKNYLSGKNEVQAAYNQGSSNSTESPSTSSNTFNKTTDDYYNDHPLTRIREKDNPPDQLSGSSNAQQLINANLDDMLHSTIRLKGLALELSNEIETQNDLIDNIAYKTDKADLNIQKQNKDMNKILKKK